MGKVEVGELRGAAKNKAVPPNQEQAERTVRKRRHFKQRGKPAFHNSDSQQLSLADFLGRSQPGPEFQMSQFSQSALSMGISRQHGV